MKTLQNYFDLFQLTDVTTYVRTKQAIVAQLKNEGYTEFDMENWEVTKIEDSFVGQGIDRGKGICFSVLTPDNGFTIRLFMRKSAFKNILVTY